MSKKIILLALAAASVAAFALPATATAEGTPLHLIPIPFKAKTIDGEGEAFLTGGFGTIKCTGSSGSATFTTTTTGTLKQTLKGCSGPTGTCTTAGQVSGTILTTELPFHLVTVTHEHNTSSVTPGILVTPNTVTNVFGHFDCPLFSNVIVSGNGLVGTINLACDAFSSEPTIQFSSKSAGVQTHTTVVGTNTSYGLHAFGGSLSEDMSLKITLGAAATLECT